MAEYERYVRGIREEYSFATEEQWRAGRGAFLKGMLRRERVYQVDALRKRWEARAKGNMERELQQIGST